MSIAIKAEKLCKTYKIYNKRLDRLKETFLPFKTHYHTPFKALENINLKIEKGDTVGIVGRNGSGKSTLLQIICGILQPTEGIIHVDGRISALLELGAGFNPEFTGLENVYLNASILGMKKEDIDTCLDDILKFADIGRFIYQPVKTYSSGMYVRLAFAVAINVKPDILIVDEALSVGDTLFQAKCFTKFREFQEKGVTILFVTHSDDLVTRYCNRAILLHNGQQIMTDKAKKVVDKYNRILADTGENKEGTEINKTTSIVDNYHSEDMKVIINPDENRYGNGDAEIIDFGIRSLSEKVKDYFLHGEPYQFWMKVRINREKKDPILAYTIKDVKGLILTGTNTLHQNTPTGHFQPGEEITVTFEHRMTLNPGEYLLSFGCAGMDDGEYTVYDRRYDVIPFKVVAEQPKVGFFDLESQITIVR